MRNPLVPIVLAFSAGIWCARYFFLSASQQLFWIGVLLAGAVVLLRMERCSYGFFVALMGFFLCGSFLAAEEHAVLPPRHIESLARRGTFHPEQPSVLMGWARTPAVLRPGGEYFDLDVTEIRQSHSTMPTQGVVRLYYFAPRKGPATLNVTYGARIMVPVRYLRRPRNYMTAGSYDWAGYMRRQGIYFTGSAKNAAILSGWHGSLWQSALYRLRARLLLNLDRLYPPHGRTRTYDAILKAMLLGDTNWLNPGITRAFKDSGTYHLLVVAGLHVGALAFGLFWLLACFRLPNWLQTLLIAVCLAAFAFMVNARIPAVRATLMILLYLAARLVYRQRALLNSIAAAALILLVLHPADLLDSGFQLSFAAVLIIAIVVVPLVEWTVSPYRRALRQLDEKEQERLLEPKQAQFRQDIRTLLDYVCDSRRFSEKTRRVLRAVLSKLTSAILAVIEAGMAVVLMQAGLSLPMAVYFHRVVWSGMAANLLVLPLMAILVPLGFAVLLVAIISWPLALAGAWALGMLVRALQSVVEWSAHLPHLESRVPAPPGWLSALFVALLLLIALLGRRRSRLVWFPIVALIPLCVIVTIAPYRARIPAGRLTLTVLDVGQGDSLFLTFPHGKTMLVDGGGEIPVGKAPPRFDVGDQVVSPALWSRDVQSIDYVVLTHDHADHLGGLPSILRNFRVGQLWIGPGPKNRRLDRLLAVARRRGVPVVRRESGDRKNIDGVKTAVLSPPADWHPKRVSNNDSLVLRLGYGARHIFLAGDMEARMEKRLLRLGVPLASEILKVGHHGSKTSTTAPFLRRVAPLFGIISVGALSRFGHPNRRVLQTLRSAGVKTYRTDQDGSVTVSTDGNKIQIARFRDRIRHWPAFRIEPVALGWLFSR